MKSEINFTKAAQSAGKILQICLLLAFALMIVTPTLTAFAAGDPPPDAESKVIGTFKKLAQMFISIAYSLMFITFAVGVVRTGLMANVAQQFGASQKVSIEFMNFVGGIGVFVFGLLTLPLVNWIVGELASTAPSSYDITVPGY